MEQQQQIELQRFADEKRQINDRLLEIADEERRMNERLQKMAIEEQRIINEERQKIADEERRMNERLQRIANEKRALTAKIIDEKMATTAFPLELLPTGWMDLVKLALMKSSPISQRADLREFVAVVETMNTPGAELSLKSFQILANSLDTVSPDDLGLEAEAYCNLVRATFTLVDKWGTLIKKINEDASLEAETQYKLKSAAAGDKAPFGGLKAEA